MRMAFCVCVTAAALLCAVSASARSVLLVDDYAGGFGPVAGLLTANGHTVTEITGEQAAGYANLANASLLTGYDFVVYSVRGSQSPSDAALTSMENYIAGGGDVLVTGLDSPFQAADRRAAKLIRAIGPEFSFFRPTTDHVVSTTNNFITNGPFGDFRGATTPGVGGNHQLFANVGLGTLPVLQAADGRPDKAIFTDLPGAGGSVGAWQDGSLNPLQPAQPDFFDGGVYQNLFLNWAAGGTTSQVEVTPQAFTTQAHPVPSTLTLDLYLGDPNAGGVQLASVGPYIVSGGIDAVGSVDAGGNGTLAITESRVDVPDVSNQLIDLGALGSLQFDASNVALHFANQPVDVAGGAFDMHNSNYYVVGLDSASLRLHTAAGPITALADPYLPLEVALDGPYLGGWYDFEPGAFTGTFDLGPGLFSSLGEVNLRSDEVAVPLTTIPGLGELFVGIRADLHFAPVPEPSSLALAIMGAATAVGFVRSARRRRNQST